jgi:hypothetical protein
MKDGSLPSELSENKSLLTAFKTIQAKAQESGINLDNAIDFVESLTEEGKEVLKRYHGLYDDISTDNMSKEGAYNLIMEQSKRADLNGDGIINIGSEVSVAFPPVDFPAGFNEVYTDALYGMQEKGASTQELYRFSFSVFEAQLGGGLAQAIAGSEQGGFDFLSNRINAIKTNLENQQGSTSKLSLVESFKSEITIRAEKAEAVGTAEPTEQEKEYLNQMNAYEAAARAAGLKA